MRFVLAHGGYHGAWCWGKLIPELETLGHTAIAVDLPGAGERLGEKATLVSWRTAISGVIDEGDILVGHSMGGYVISMAADEVPEKIAGLVFLSAAVPVEGLSMAQAATQVDQAWAETVDRKFEDFTKVVDIPGQGPCLVMTDPAAANQIFYHDCKPEDQAWAFDHLTPLPLEATTAPMSVPRFWTAPIPKSYILCTDDRSHPVQDDNEFMSRLGLTTCMAIISSHSPFLSRPRDTANLLDAWTTTLRD